MSWASTIRQWWDELFYSSHSKHLEEEIKYLRNQVEQMRLDNAKLQLTLNSVTPAGVLSARQQNPPKRPEQTGPVVKRWAQLEAERYAQIDEDRRKKLAEMQTSKAA